MIRIVFQYGDHGRSHDPEKGVIHIVGHMPGFPGMGFPCIKGFLFYDKIFQGKKARFKCFHAVS